MRITKLLLITGLLCTAACLAQGRFIEDVRTHCLVWDEYYSPKDSVSWSGGCKNNYAHGKGTLLWFEDGQKVAQYVGRMQNGKPNGKGKYDIVGSGTMIGFFADGLLQGQAQMRLANGGAIQGNFVDGTFLNLDQKYLKRLQKIHSKEKDTTEIYTNDDANGLFYYVLAPPKSKGVLVLLPSTGENAENVISCNKELLQQCFDRQILTVVPSINYNKTLESDAAAFAFLNATFEEISSRFHVPKERFILSGLSLGGSNALQYTEMSRNPKFSTSIKPIGVIGVDPAVDEVDLYDHAKESIVRYANAQNLSKSLQDALAENYFLIDYFQKLYGGPPAEVPQRYIDGSVFSRREPDGGNARFLIEVPVRLYADPDILWNLKYKNRDYYHMNAANLSAMTNFLLMKGNQRAEFIPAIGKGFRIDGTRHPHSWSIVDPTDCIKWMLDLLR